MSDPKGGYGDLAIFFGLVAIFFFVIFVVAVVNAGGLHESWCKERMAGASEADTIAVLLDDEFCATVLSP